MRFFRVDVLVFAHLDGIIKLMVGLFVDSLACVQFFFIYFTLAFIFLAFVTTIISCI